MKKFILCGLFLIFVGVISIFYSILSEPFVNDNQTLKCEYKSISNKIICTEIGDIVPEWLDVPKTDMFSRNIIFLKSSEDYISMPMTDYIFITDLHRKFVYTLNDKNLWDFIEFKDYITKTGIISNYGAAILMCSDSTLDKPVCKMTKNRHENKYW